MQIRAYYAKKKFTLSRNPIHTGTGRLGEKACAGVHWWNGESRSDSGE